MYVIRNIKTQQVWIYKDRTHLNVSSRTLWYNKDKETYTKGDLMLHFNVGGNTKSNSGGKNNGLVPFKAKIKAIRNPIIKNVFIDL